MTSKIRGIKTKKNYDTKLQMNLYFTFGLLNDRTVAHDKAEAEYIYDIRH